MKEVMIPTFKWNNEYWCLKKEKDIKNINNIIRYCDGHISNLLIDVEDIDNCTKEINKLFSRYEWLNKIVVKNRDSLVGYFVRKNEEVIKAD